MEKNSSSKKVGSSSSSSSIAELFGPKEPSSTSSYSHSSSSSASSTIFGSVFGPPSMGRGRDLTSQAGMVNKHGAPDNMGKNSKGESSKDSYYQQETIDQPFSFSSSIYYGGQEVYSPTTRASESQLTFKKDDKDDDPNTASRGNWWQGSLYY